MHIRKACPPALLEWLVYITQHRRLDTQKDAATQYLLGLLASCLSVDDADRVSNVCFTDRSSSCEPLESQNRSFPHRIRFWGLRALGPHGLLDECFGVLGLSYILFRVLGRLGLYPCSKAA